MVGRPGAPGTDVPSFVSALAALPDGTIAALQSGADEPVWVLEANGEAWTALPGGTPRFHGQLVAVDDGDLLVVGGAERQGCCLSSVASPERWDASSETWQAAPARPVELAIGAVAWLAGSPFVFGGVELPGGPASDACSRFDVSQGSWATCGSLGAARGLHTSTPLDGSRALITGGTGSGQIEPGALLASAAIYDAVTDTWTDAAPMSTPRAAHAAVRLLDGRVLVAGGLDEANAPMSSAEIFDPEAGVWSPATSMSVARHDFALALLADGRVLAVGTATPPEGEAASDGSVVEIYLPGDDAWVRAPDARRPRHLQHALPLEDGRLFVLGSSADGSLTPEIYEEIPAE